MTRSVGWPSPRPVGSPWSGRGPVPGRSWLSPRPANWTPPSTAPGLGRPTSPGPAVPPLDVDVNADGFDLALEPDGRIVVAGRTNATLSTQQAEFAVFTAP